LRITVNGEQHETQAATLEQLCAAMGYGEQRIATALNGEFVPAEARQRTRLHDNDRIEIVAPRQGG
jgi:sulfur carrier protein